MLGKTVEFPTIRDENICREIVQQFRGEAKTAGFRFTLLVMVLGKLSQNLKRG
jgi:hypothetical protein